MKETAVTHSIGEALRGCAVQGHAGQHPVRPALDFHARGRQAAPPMHLTQRQLEVLALLCEGLPNKLICRRLNIATGTVKVHISCILRELKVRSRLEAVVAARRLGLFREPVGGVAGLVELAIPMHRPEAAGVRQAFGRYGDAIAF